MSTLTPAQVERVQAVALALTDAAPAPLEDWIDDLSADDDPEQQLQAWEACVVVFQGYTHPTSTLRRKREVLLVCLATTSAKEEVYNTLSDEEVEGICRDLQAKSLT